MLPTQDYLDKIAATIIDDLFPRSNVGGIVRKLIEGLQDAQINVTAGIIESGPFMRYVHFPHVRFDQALQMLADLASVNIGRVQWGWRIDHMARVHFAPVDHLPEN